MDDDKTLSGPERLKNFRQLHREEEILSDVVTQLVLEVGPLEDAEICLSVGTGCGEYDVIFAKHFLPNLKKFIAVEKDRSYIKELKRNLENSFGNDSNKTIFVVAQDRITGPQGHRINAS